MKIFLIGMMGSGKSYWLNKLATPLDLSKYDLDAMIEQEENRSIFHIFSESGETHFRKMESMLLKRFAGKENYLLATGGGTPCFHDNMQWMNKEGLTIWIDEPLDQLVQRLLPEKAGRPLIASLDATSLQDFLEKKYSERAPVYSQAKLRLRDDNINLAYMLSTIKQYYNV